MFWSVLVSLLIAEGTAVKHTGMSDIGLGRDDDKATPFGVLSSVEKNANIKY